MIRVYNRINNKVVYKLNKMINIISHNTIIN